MTPDGRSLIVRGLDEKKSGTLGFFRIDLVTGDQTPVVRLSGPDQRPELSADGGRLYFRRFVLDNDNQVHFVERDLSTGEERTVLQRERGGLASVNLSPDGQHVATAGRAEESGSRAVVLSSTSGGADRELMRMDEPGELAILMWAPDSRSVFIRKTINGGPELWRVPISDGTPRRLDVDIRGIQGHLRVSPDGRQVAFAAPVAPKPAELWVLENFLPKSAAARK